MKAENYVKPFKNYSATWIFAVLPFHPITKKSVHELLYAAWKNFYIIQQKQKLHITRIPLVSVDHPLDTKIPFVPKNIKIYMDFVDFFCRIMRMLICQFQKEGYQASNKIVDFIRELYQNAGTIYSHALSTTNRPFYIGKPKFLVIHLFDPHYLCVPSLHVAIVLGVWAKVRQLTARMNITTTEKESILSEIYKGSVAITESVLFVKQHSINCVAGALYMLSASHPEGFFTKNDAENFVCNLFKNDSCIIEADKEKIRNHIISMYSDLMDKKNSQTEWQKPLHDWLDNYKA
ncbi:MAG: hypothetical protein IJL70_06340 [Treponema sp.]|nr:hypothetical protein [Treponema sp.]